MATSEGVDGDAMTSDISLSLWPVGHGVKIEGRLLWPLIPSGLPAWEPPTS